MKHIVDTTLGPNLSAMCGMLLCIFFIDKESHSCSVRMELCSAGCAITYYREGRSHVSCFCREIEICEGSEFPYNHLFSYPELRSMLFNILGIFIPEERRMAHIVLYDYDPDHPDSFNNHRDVLDSSYFEVGYYGMGYLKWKCTKVQSVK